MEEGKARVGKEMENYKPCSFCGGTGVFAKKEKEATPEEAGSEDFWKEDKE
jgi:hypothetical protein